MKSKISADEKITIVNLAIECNRLNCLLDLAQRHADA